MKKFKALIPFSNDYGIYNPGDEVPGEASSELVEAWIEAGYAVEVTGIEDMDGATNPFDEKVPQNPPVKDEDEKRAEMPVNDAEMIESAKVQGEHLTQEIDGKTEELTPVVTNAPAYEQMSYPQLKKAAKEKGILRYNSMKQADLVEALQKKGE